MHNKARIVFLTYQNSERYGQQSLPGFQSEEESTD